MNRPLKVGDRVRFKHPQIVARGLAAIREGREFQVGDEAVVACVEEEGRYFAAEPDGELGCVLSALAVEIVEVKAGSRIRLLEDACLCKGDAVGDVLTVKRIDEDGDVRFGNGRYDDRFYDETEYELLADDAVAFDFKVGQRYLLANGDEAEVVIDAVSPLERFSNNGDCFVLLKLVKTATKIYCTQSGVVPHLPVYDIVRLLGEAAEPPVEVRKPKVGDRIRLLPSAWFVGSDMAGDILTVNTVDHEGGLYVSSAGDSSLRFYIPDEYELTTEAAAPASKLIAFYSPRPGSGKTTAAESLPDDFSIVSFADPLKGMMASLLTEAGYSDDDVEELLYGHRKNEILDFCGRTPREMMQTLGTDWGRDLVARDLWINVARRVIERELQDGDVVIDDMRFPNEFELVKELGGTTVKIVRSDADGNAPAHASEGGLDGYAFDHIIHNNGTVEELEAAVASIVDGSAALLIKLGKVAPKAPEFKVGDRVRVLRKFALGFGWNERMDETIGETGTIVREPFSLIEHVPFIGVRFEKHGLWYYPREVLEHVAEEAPFKITGSGTYRTRNGETVHISRLVSPHWPDHPWNANCNNWSGNCWREDGTWSAEAGRKSDNDIVELVKLDDLKFGEPGTYRNRAGDLVIVTRNRPDSSFLPAEKFPLRFGVEHADVLTAAGRYNEHSIDSEFDLIERVD